MPTWLPGFIASVVGAGVALWLAFKGRAAKVGDDALDRRFDALEKARGVLEKDFREVLERLHQAEIRAERLDGELKVATTGHDTLRLDVADIKAKMVFRDEWETQMAQLRKHLESFERKFDELHDAVLVRAARQKR